MADFTQKTRSNRFRVQDVDSFIADIERYGVVVDRAFDHYGPEDGRLIVEPSGEDGGVRIFYTFVPSFEVEEVFDRLYELAPERLEDAGLVVTTRPDGREDRVELPEDPYETFSAMGIEDPAIDLVHLISRHIVEDDVAVLMSIGEEKWNVFSGSATAVDSSYDVKTVVLSDIYAIAEQSFGAHKNITECED